MMNVQSATGAAPFSGAAESHTVETPRNAPVPPAPPGTGEVDVQVSAQSRAVSAPRASSVQDAGAFAQAGARQYEVFSSYLQNAGLEAAEIGSLQTVLQDITGAMDAIAPSGNPVLSESAPSQAAAQLALASSTAALEQIGSRLPVEIQGGFQELIGQYKEHNERVVANYQSIQDIRDTSIASAGPPLPAYTEGKRRSESSEIMRKLGSIAHSEMDRQEVTQAYAAIFDAARKNGTDVATMFRKVQTAFMSYASGGSVDAAVREALSARNAPVMEKMESYWTRILGNGSDFRKMADGPIESV